MNIALFKQGMKAGWKTLVIFLGVMSMYVTIMVFMFDPELSKVINSFYEIMPQMMAAFGMNPSETTLTGFLVSYLYGFILIIFPMVYIFISSNSLIVRHVEKGSMAYLLASPNKRSNIAVTQAINLILNIFIMIFYVAFLAIIVSEIAFPGELDIKRYLILNAGAFCLHFFIGGLCFFASCISNEVRRATLIGCGISVICYLFKSLANAGEKFEELKYASFFTLFNPNLLIKQSVDGYLMALCLLAAGIILFAAAIYSFNRRDLHI